MQANQVLNFFQKQIQTGGQVQPEETGKSTMSTYSGFSAYSGAVADANRGMQNFIVESEQMMQDFLQELKFRHQEYLSTLNIPIEEGQPQAASRGMLPVSYRTAGNGARHDPFVKQIDEHVAESFEPFVTERVLRQVLYSELEPLRLLKDDIAAMLAPMMSSVERCLSSRDVVGKPSHEESSKHPAVVSDIGRGESSHEDTEKKACSPSHAQFVVDVDVNDVKPELVKNDSDDTCGEEPSNEGEDQEEAWYTTMVETLAGQNADQSVGGLHRGHSNLNFARDILGQYDESAADIDNMLMGFQKFKLPLLRRRAFVEPDRVSAAAQLLQSSMFERIVAVVIFVNCIFITYSTDYAVSHPKDQSNTFIKAVEVAFQIFYVFELALKLKVHALYFFVNQDYAWNWLDACVVLGAVYDIFMTWCAPAVIKNNVTDARQTGGFSVTYLRILRLLRLTKVIRVFRVMRFFRELNVLLRVVTSTLQPLFWCTFMLVVFYYIFAIVFAHGAANYLARDDGVAEARESFKVHFGSVTKAMISLFKASTGGADWGEIAKPLEEAGSVYYCLFLFFIAFVILALLNILTGLFVDRAMRGVAEDKDGMVMERLHEDRVVVLDLCRIFCAMTGEDMDSGTSLSVDTFQDHMSSPVMRARLGVIDLDIWNSAQFFECLTAISGTEDVDLPTFVTGCMQLRGLARRTSLQSMNDEMIKLRKLIKAVHVHNHETVKKHHATIKKHMHSRQSVTSKQSRCSRLSQHSISRHSQISRFEDLGDVGDLADEDVRATDI